MTMPATARRSPAAIAFVLAAATALGCGVIRDARRVVDTATILGDFADQLGRARDLTYTAEYTLTGGDSVTVVQAPPNAAFVGKSGQFIVTRESMLMCGTKQGKTTCQRTPNQTTAMDATTSAAVAGAVGKGFVTPELALGLVAAAALVPGAKATESQRTIGGQESLCADVKGVDAGSQPETLKDFSVCVTQAGVLAAFNGTSTTGEKVSIELRKFSQAADARAFAAPPGAQIVDVSTLPAGK